MKRLALLLSVTSIFGFTPLGCKSHAFADTADPATSANIDLSSMAPIGYEICEGRGVKLYRELVNLKLRLPPKIEIPPSARQNDIGVIQFHPGQHAVDLYKDLHTPRLLHTKGEVSPEAGAPTIHVQLDTRALSTGKYVLGISGDPVFAYCTVDVE